MYYPEQQGYQYQSPYQARLNQYTQQQPQRDGVIRVTGIDGARAYQMPANSAAALFDAGQDIFYIKTTDGAGFPTIRTYAFVPVEDKPQQPAAATEYLTKKEFEAWKEEMMNGKQSVFRAGATEPTPTG